MRQPKLFFCTFLALLIGQESLCAEEKEDYFSMDLETLMTIAVDPSADASAGGLSPPFAGGQVAEGGRLGIIGSQSTMDSGFILKSYTKEFVQNQQVTSVGDILRLDPVIRVARGFGNFQQVYMSRGFPIYSGDMTYNGLHGILPRQYLAAELIERVEVLRGAGAFAFGDSIASSGSFGGVVNVMPKRAKKEDKTSLSVGARDDKTYLAADISHRFKGERVGLRLNMAERDGDTAVDGEERSLRLLTLGADVYYDRFRFSADVGYQDRKLTASTPSVTLGTSLSVIDAPEASSRIAQPWTFSNEEDLFGTIRVEFDVHENIKIWSAVGAREGEEDSVLTAFVTTLDDAGNYSGNRFDVVHEDSVFTAEAGVRYQLKWEAVEHNLVFSYSQFKNDARNAFLIYEAFTDNLYDSAILMPTSVVTFAGGELGDPLVTLKTSTHSFAIADEMVLLDEKIRLLLALRSQSIEDENLDYNSGDSVSVYSKSALVPAASVVYKSSGRTSYYANYTEGLLQSNFAPTANESGLVVNAGDALDPIASEQIEAGVKYDFGDLGLTLSAFEIRKEVTGFSSSNAFTVTDKQSHKGLEFSFYGLLTQDIKLLGGVSILNTKLKGKRVVGVPNAQVNVGAEWALPRFENFSLSSHYLYSGSQYADVDNIQKVPSWSRVDLGVRYSHELQSGNRLTARFNIENALDESYWASVGGFPGEGYLTLGDPRSFVGSLTYQF